MKYEGVIAKRQIVGFKIVKIAGKHKKLINNKAVLLKIHKSASKH